MTFRESLSEDPRLTAEVAEHPYPLLFVTVSGAHLYGFPSPDSDFDLRGIHVLPIDEALSLGTPTETLTLSHLRDGAEVDLVTHDARKFFTLLLRNNGYVLEQLYSPLVVHTTPEHEELKEIARGCITRKCLRHYMGFAQNQWHMFTKESPRRLKPLLYVYRVLLTGIRLMRSGDLNANLLECNEDFKLPYIGDLVARKVEGTEKGTFDDDFTFHEAEFRRLLAALEEAGSVSPLPEDPTAREALNDLLLRVRWKTGRPR